MHALRCVPLCSARARGSRRATQPQPQGNAAAGQRSRSRAGRSYSPSYSRVRHIPATFQQCAAHRRRPRGGMAGGGLPAAPSTAWRGTSPPLLRAASAVGCAAGPARTPPAKRSTSARADRLDRAGRERKGGISARSPAEVRTLAPAALRTAHSHARTYTGKACLACDGACVHTAAARARAGVLD